MRGRKLWPLGCAVVAALCMVVTPRSAAAQPRAWLASLSYESSNLYVPVLFVTSTNDKGREWSAGLTGWTLTADVKSPTGEGRARHLFARVTPLNANASNLIYRDGVRDRAAEFRAFTAEGGLGIDIAHTSRWTGGYRAMVAYERIRGIADSDVSAFWRQPFAGIEIVQQYIRVRSDERFGTRWDGVKVAAVGHVMGGAHMWADARLAAGVGTRAGPVFFSGRGTVFGGHALNVVNAFVLGGSWDLPTAGMVPGYRYGEFRLDRAVIVGGAADIRLRGQWELGFRAGTLNGRLQDARGAAVQLGTIWRGAAFTAGVAFPSGPRADRTSRGAVGYATVTAAIIQR